MSQNECFKHRHYAFAGVYKRDNQGKYKLDKNGERVLVQPKDTYVCPRCHTVFLKPRQSKRFRTPRRKIKHGKQYNRTVSKILR